MTDYYVAPLEGQSRADALAQVRDAQTELLEEFPDTGEEAELDMLAMASFRWDPPAFLLRSVKK